MRRWRRTSTMSVGRMSLGPVDRRLRVSLAITVLVSCCFTLAKASAPPSILDDDALLHGLRLEKARGCESERLTLQCPRGTALVIKEVFYGRAHESTPTFCPASSSSSGSSSSGDVGMLCEVQQAFSIVSSTCASRRKCSVDVQPRTFGAETICANTKKYLQIAYLCRPNHFESAVFCGGSQMDVACREGRRLAVYSAHFGRTRLPQPLCTADSSAESDVTIEHDCLEPVLSAVHERCHARTDCQLSVTASHLAVGRGSCAARLPANAAYLQLVYMCVNEEVFSDETLKRARDGGNSGVGDDYSSETIPLEQAAVEAVTDDWTRERVDDTLKGEEEEAKEEEEEPEENDRLRAASATAPRHAVLQPIQPPHQPPVLHYSHEDVHGGGVYRHAADDLNGFSFSRPSITELPPPADDPNNAVGMVYDLYVLLDYLQENAEKALAIVIVAAASALALFLLACIWHHARRPAADYKGAAGRRKRAQLDRLGSHRQAPLSSLDLYLDGAATGGRESPLGMRRPSAVDGSLLRLGTAASSATAHAHHHRPITLAGATASLHNTPPSANTTDTTIDGTGGLGSSARSSLSTSAYHERPILTAVSSLLATPVHSSTYGANRKRSSADTTLAATLEAAQRMGCAAASSFDAPPTAQVRPALMVAPSTRATHVTFDLDRLQTTSLVDYAAIRHHHRDSASSSTPQTSASSSSSQLIRSRLAANSGNSLLRPAAATPSSLLSRTIVTPDSAFAESPLPASHYHF